MIFVEIALIFLFTLHYVESANKFKKNASDFIDVGFNKGRTGTRLAEIAVKIRPGEMFEGGESVSVEDLVLEVKSGEDCWSRVEDRPVKRGKDKHMWRVKVVPCKKHQVRLGIRREDCVEYLEYPDTVGPATAEEIANSHFRPARPEHVVITPLAEDSVAVSWIPSPCAESYELWYESDQGEDSGNITVSAGFGSVTVRELQHCTDYTVYVTALVGEEFSDAGEGEFTTCNATAVDIHDEATDTILDVKPNQCQIKHEECKLVKPEMIKNHEDISVHENETIPEVKSDPKALTQESKATATTTTLCVLLMLILSQLL
jgi:hypothetical protein